MDIKATLRKKFAGKVPFTKKEGKWTDENDWHPVDELRVKSSYIKRLQRIAKHGKFIEANSLDDLLRK
ncbi:MAG TPA: hypothetical protein VJI13_04390 [Candidatus Norongarragalinales archaeon]|nr:hypothetical protein [Candidatus Norongarragalinales archaeon]